MSNKIKIGNLNISSFKVGGSDCSIYLGTVKVYPQAPTFKFSATYSNDTSYSAACDGNTTLTTGTTRAHTTPYSAMTSAVIGDCVTSIGDFAFFYCKNLTSVTISDSVTSIGDSSFTACSGLTSMDLPSGLTSIGTYALHGCRGLTSLDIPSGVTNISEYGIYQCSNLQSITVNATTPPTLGTGAFDQTNNCPIYVPAESVDAYKSATTWRTYYSSRIQAIPTT